MIRRKLLLGGMALILGSVWSVPVFGGSTILEHSGDFFPDTVGNQWTYHGEVRKGPLQSVNQKIFLNVSTITGTETIDGVEVSVFHETNQGNLGAFDNYYRRDAAGIRYYGRTPEATLEKQLVPYQIMTFPLTIASTFQQFNKTGLEMGMDLDKDGKNDQADMKSEVHLVGLEPVSVPAGVYPSALRVDMRMTFTFHLSKTKRAVTGRDFMTVWLVRGIGLVKYIERQEDPPVRSDRRRVTETIEELAEVNLVSSVASCRGCESPTNSVVVTHHSGSHTVGEGAISHSLGSDTGRPVPPRGLTSNQSPGQ